MELNGWIYIKIIPSKSWHRMICFFCNRIWNSISSTRQCPLGIRNHTDTLVPSTTKKSRLFWCHVSGERTPQLWWFYRVYNQVPNHWYCDVLRLWEWCDAPHNSCSVRYPLVFLDSREAPLYVQVRAFAWHMQMIHTYGNHKIDRHIGNLEIWSTYYWLVVWNMFYDFQYIGNHHPNWLSYFSEG
jgi:hypothetical protein